MKTINTKATMKTVFRSDEIAHVWAHEHAPLGKSPGSRSFDGDVFYSYSTAIARRVRRKGKVAYIVDTAQFSVTTAKHQSAVRCAIGDGETVFAVSSGRRGQSLNLSGRELFEHYRDRAIKMPASSRAPRLRRSTRDARAGDAAWFMQQANDAARWFGLRCRVSQRQIDRLAAAAERVQKLAAVEQSKREAAARKKLAVEIARWQSGERAEPLYNLQGETLLRVNAAGDVETSRGVVIPRAEAALAVRFVQRHRETGWQRNGERYAIAGYQLDTVSAASVRAGCHVIGWASIEAIAAKLNA